MANWEPMDEKMRKAFGSGVPISGYFMTDHAGRMVPWNPTAATSPQQQLCGAAHPKHHGTTCELPEGHGGPLHMHHFEKGDHHERQVYCWLVEGHSMSPEPEVVEPMIVIDLEDYV
jgi:hypothetical protein